MKKQQKIYQVTIIGIFGGLTFFLAFTPFGFIPLGFTNLTIAHLPTIIAAIIGGPISGMLVGLIFGFSSMISAVLRPAPTSIAFLNPLIAILPRVAIGIVTAFVFLRLKKYNLRRAIVIAAICGTLTNSILVLTGLLLFYHQLFNQSFVLAAQIIGIIFLTNGIPEMILSALFVPFVATAILARQKKF